MSEILEINCDNCGKVLRVPKNRAGQNGKCAYCEKSVYIPFPEEIETQHTPVVAPSTNLAKKNKKRQTEYGIPKALSVASYKKPKNKNTKKTSKFFLMFLFFCVFILGNATGYIFSEQIKSYIKILSKEDISIVNVNVTPINSTNETVEIIDVTELNPSDNEHIDDETIEDLKKAEENITELKREFASLEKMSSILASKYKVNLGDEFYQILDKISQEVNKSDKIYLDFKNLIKDKKIAKIKEKIIELKNSEINNFLVLKNITQEKNKLQKRLDKYLKNAPKKTKISIKYMHKWYRKLLKNTKKIESIYRKVTMTTTSASIKYRAIQNEIKKIKHYGHDIKKATKSLEAKINEGKDPYDWVKKRRQNARSIPQTQQADMLEEFINKNKKFYVDIEGELNILSNTIKSISKKTTKRLRAETNLRNILRSLQAINRKWEEAYQTFDSAISNFTIKED